MNIAIIGGGAAGFFLAIQLKQHSPEVNVTIYEKNRKVLSKVAVSGGGRCNLTNSFREIHDLNRAYPRGARLMKHALKMFHHEDTCRWFEERGVPLVTQDDECVFPRSQNSQSIIDCFLWQCKELNVVIKTGHGVEIIQKTEDDLRYKLIFSNETIDSQTYDKVAITTGGTQNADSFKYIEDLSHSIIEPIPSLFSFTIPNDAVTELMGIVVENATVSLQGTKLKGEGALLITHWGMSGPAVLKLSSYSAKQLREKDYRFQILVNWVPESNCDAISTYLNDVVDKNPQKLVSTIRPYDLSSRHWMFLLKKIGIPTDRRWNELGRKGINKIVNILCSDEYSVHGRGTFRDEFVTCGGVSLDSIHFQTMESKSCRGLFFAGEVLDIDAITGGFNLQAAWTTAYVAAQGMLKE